MEEIGKERKDVMRKPVDALRYKQMSTQKLLPTRKLLLEPCIAGAVNCESVQRKEKADYSTRTQGCCHQGLAS
jgi:hypothetical protein